MPEGRELQGQTRRAGWETPPLTPQLARTRSRSNRSQTRSTTLSDRSPVPKVRVPAHVRRGDGLLTVCKSAGTAYEGGRFVVDIGSSLAPLFRVLGRLSFHKFQFAHVLYMNGVQWHPRGIRSNRSK